MEMKPERGKGKNIQRKFVSDTSLNSNQTCDDSDVLEQVGVLVGKGQDGL